MRQWVVLPQIYILIMKGTIQIQEMIINVFQGRVSCMLYRLRHHLWRSFIQHLLIGYAGRLPYMHVRRGWGYQRIENSSNNHVQEWRRQVHMVGIIVSFFEVVGLKLKLIMKQSLYMLLLNASSRILGHMTCMIFPTLVLMFVFM